MHRTTGLECHKHTLFISFVCAFALTIPSPGKCEGEWGEWGACDVTCGTGQRTRDGCRKSVKPGKTCPPGQETTQTEMCSSASCVLSSSTTQAPTSSSVVLMTSSSSGKTSSFVIASSPRMMTSSSDSEVVMPSTQFNQVSLESTTIATLISSIKAKNSFVDVMSSSHIMTSSDVVSSSRIMTSSAVISSSRIMTSSAVMSSSWIMTSSVVTSSSQIMTSSGVMSSSQIMTSSAVMSSSQIVTSSGAFTPSLAKSMSSPPASSVVIIMTSDSSSVIHPSPTKSSHVSWESAVSSASFSSRNVTNKDNMSSRQAYFAAEENWILLNHVIKEVCAPSEITCAMFCLRHENCQSINFKFTTKDPNHTKQDTNCQLNSAKHLTHPKDFLPKKGYRYCYIT